MIFSDVGRCFMSHSSFFMFFPFSSFETSKRRDFSDDFFSPGFAAARYRRMQTMRLVGAPGGAKGNHQKGGKTAVV
jgi:hypothetical protein